MMLWEGEVAREPTIVTVKVDGEDEEFAVFDEGHTLRDILRYAIDQVDYEEVLYMVEDMGAE